MSDNENAADALLVEAADAISARAVLRDQPDGERSMRRTVAAFNALTGHRLTEEQGWLFMAVLKMARSVGGEPNRDDYIDQAAYAALAGECALGGQLHPDVVHQVHLHARQREEKRAGDR